PYLSSNLEFGDDDNLRPLVVADGQDAGLIGGSLARSATITVGGERIGVVGATTPHLRRLTNAGGIKVSPDHPHDYGGLAAEIQSAVDELLSQGINKVVLLAHMQTIGIEIELAWLLRGVDIIVAGGSNAVLADETDRLRAGDEAGGDYPLVFESAVGEPVLVVNAGADYRYVGRLVVDFDEWGVVIPESVDEFVSGAYSTETQGGQAFSGLPVREVSEIVDSLTTVMRERGGNVIGKTSVYLAGSRPEVRTQETNMGNLVTDSYLWLARLVDPEVAVALKNSGGIRDHIGVALQPPGTNDPQDVQYLPPPANELSGTEEGDISQFDVQGVLRFNNALVILPLTAAQLVEAMEHSIGYEGVGEVFAGRFPQVSGMRFSFDPSLPIGERVRSLAIVDDQGDVIDRVVENGELIGDAARVIKMVTINFIANGGDGYPFPSPLVGRVDLAGEAVQFNAPDSEFPDTNGNGVIDEPAGIDPGLVDFADIGTEQEALAEYLARFFGDIPFDEAETTPLHDQRVQNLRIPGKVDKVFE
ncbi:MAG: bifunctional metallophosphatase/5'-nucleotidase, partial [Chloroflexi bacterium]|nr:bifunctional metallophosphatase/5'-nucleotidase [Chloroflexota bacterium]